MQVEAACRCSFLSFRRALQMDTRRLFCLRQPLEAVARAAASTLSTAPRAHNQIEAISVQDGRAQALPPTPCLIRTPVPPEQAHAPQHSTCGTSRASTRTPATQQESNDPNNCAWGRVQAARLEPCSCPFKLGLRIGCAQNPLSKCTAGRHAI